MTLWRTLSIKDETKKRLEQVEIDGDNSYDGKLSFLLDMYERLDRTGFLEILKAL
jgi:hypothetical protein